MFKYTPQTHDVLEVNKAAYDSCTTSNAIANHTTGNDVIRLDATGTRYFICGITGHCAGGMKLQVDVVMPGSTSMPPAGAPGASPPPPPSTPGSSATKATATGFGLAAVMLAAGLMA